MSCSALSYSNSPGYRSSYCLQALCLTESLKVRPAMLTIDILYHSNITFPAGPWASADIVYRCRTERSKVQLAEMVLKQLKKVRHSPRRCLCPPFSLVLGCTLIWVILDRVLGVFQLPVLAPMPMHGAPLRVQQQNTPQVALVRREANDMRQDAVNVLRR